MKTLLPALCLLFPGLFSAQTTLYVREAAMGQATGQSWTDAFTDLQLGLAAAHYGDTIRLAEGVYLPAPTNSTDRTATFFLKNGVAILGGYSGNPLLPDERDPATWISYLYGDIGIPDEASDNVYSVITATGNLDERTVLDGVQVVGGNANSLNGPGSIGGGLIGGTTLTEIQNFRVQNCAFFANSARLGGAVFCSGNAGSRPTFEWCDFYLNSAEFDGGAMYLSYTGPEPIVCRHLFFESNTATLAPDLYIEAKDGTKSIYMSNCAFSAHAFVPSNVSGCYLNGQIDTTSIKVDSCTFTGLTGGPFLLANARGGIQVSDCRFSNNKTAGYTDVMRLWKVGPSNQKITVENCVFEKNNGYSLGFFIAGSPAIRHCRFDNNSVQYGLYLESSSRYQVENCAFTGTKATGSVLHTHSGGDLLVRQSIFRENTAVLFTAPSFNINQINRTNWEFCTFFGNKWYVTPPLAPYLFNFSNVDTTTFNSCLLADFDPQKKLFQKTDPGALRLSHSLLRYADAGNILPTAGVLVIDSTDLLGLQPDFQSSDPLDLHLSPCSPGLNGGDPTLAAMLGSDFAGVPRSLNGAPDVGAFETLLFVKKDTVVGSCADHATGRVEYGGYACPPFTYVWSDGATTGTDTVAMPPGNYALTITAANGIDFQDSVTIAPTPLELAILEALSVQCAGLADGVALVDFTAGHAPYQYVWSNGQTTPLAFNLPAGPLTLTVTDGNGCVTTAIGVISGPMPLEALLITSPASALTANDGTILVDAVSGGTEPYQYAWSTGVSGPWQTGLVAGSYMLTLTDGNGCQIVLTTQVDVLVNTDIPIAENRLQLLPSRLATGESSRLVAKGTMLDKVLIFNASGQLMRILQPAAMEVELSTRALPAGMYMVQVTTTDNRRHTLRWQIW